MSRRVRAGRGLTRRHPATYCWCPTCKIEAAVLPTLVGGGIALIIAILFLGTILIKIPSVALWIVVLIGIALMIVSVVEAVRAGEDQFGGS
jgi:hypothetical protein